MSSCCYDKVLGHIRTKVLPMWRPTFKNHVEGNLSLANVAQIRVILGQVVVTDEGYFLYALKSFLENYTHPSSISILYQYFLQLLKYIDIHRVIQNLLIKYAMTPLSGEYSLYFLQCKSKCSTKIKKLIYFSKYHICYYVIIYNILSLNVRLIKE